MKFSDSEIRETRQWLYSYRLTIKEINARREHYEEFVKDIYNPLKCAKPDAQANGTKTAAGRHFDIERLYGEMAQEMLDKINQLQALAREIERAIDTLDEFERMILYYRYIVGVAWIDMPGKVGYEIAQCQRIERRAIQHLNSDAKCTAERTVKAQLAMT